MKKKRKKKKKKKKQKKICRLHFAFVCRLLRVNLINVKSNNCILFLITTKSRTRTKHDTKLKD